MFFLKSQKSLCWIRQPFSFLSPGCKNSRGKKKKNPLVTTLNTKKKLDLFYSYELAFGDPAPTMVLWLKTPKFNETISKY
jgi:hypothetical protein